MHMTLLPESAKMAPWTSPTYPVPIIEMFKAKEVKSEKEIVNGKKRERKSSW